MKCLSLLSTACVFALCVSAARPLAGCETVAVPHIADQPRVVELREPSRAAERFTLEREEHGAPSKRFYPVVPAAGFAVWVDHGGLWHVRPRSSGELHGFRAQLRPVSGTIADASLRSDALRAQVRRTSRGGAAFALLGSSEAEELTVRSDSRCMVFYLQLDDGPGAGQTVLGAQQRHAFSEYFELCRAQ